MELHGVKWISQINADYAEMFSPPPEGCPKGGVGLRERE